MIRDTIDLKPTFKRIKELSRGNYGVVYAIENENGQVSKVQKV